MKTIIEMAREAGMAGFDGVVHAAFQLEAFAELVRADERERLTDAAMKAAEKAVDTAMALEREACAKVCEAERVLGIDDERAYYGDLMAAAIRARGNT